MAAATKKLRVLLCLLAAGFGWAGTSFSQQEKPPAALTLSYLGTVSEAQRRILFNRLEERLSEKYDLVSQQRFREAQDAAFEALDVEQCTEENCIRKIQEILQIENLFILQILRDEGDTQLSLTQLELETKTVKTDYCEGCGTRELNRRINSLLDRLLGAGPLAVAAKPKPTPARPAPRVQPPPPLPRVPVAPTPAPPAAAPARAVPSPPPQVSAGRRINRDEMRLGAQAALGYSVLSLIASPRRFPPTEKSYAYGYWHNLQREDGATAGYRVGWEGPVGGGLFSFYHNRRDWESFSSGYQDDNRTSSAEYVFLFENSTYAGARLENYSTEDTGGNDYQRNRLFFRGNAPLGDVLRIGWSLSPATDVPYTNNTGDSRNAGTGLRWDLGVAYFLASVMTLELDLLGEQENLASGDSGWSGTRVEMLYRFGKTQIELVTRTITDSSGVTVNDYFAVLINMQFGNLRTVLAQIEESGVSTTTATTLVTLAMKLGEVDVGLQYWPFETTGGSTNSGATTRVHLSLDF